MNIFNKNHIIGLLSLSFLSINTTFAQHNNELYNKGAVITVQAGAEIHVLGDVHQDGGDIANSGLIKLDGHWYNDNAASTQSGTGLVTFQNDKTNAAEDQQIRGTADLTGSNAFYDVDLNNTGTNQLVYLNAVNAEMKNTLEFVAANERFRTATANTNQGNAFANYVHVSNAATTAIVSPGTGGAVVHYIEGRLRRSMMAASTYNLPVGFGTSAVDAAAFGNQIASVTAGGTGVMEISFNRETGGNVSAPDPESDHKTAKYANHGFWRTAGISGTITPFNITITPSNTAAAPFATTQCKYTLGRGTAGGAYTTDGNGTQDISTNAFGAQSRTAVTLFNDYTILGSELYQPKAAPKAFCFGGSATLDAYDASLVGTEPNVHSTLVYSWSPSGGSAEVTGAIAAPDNSNTIYTVTVSDGNGCTLSTTARVIINQLPVLTLAPGCNNALPTNRGSWGASATLGLAGYTFSPGASASGLADGNHSVLVTDANGCTSQKSVTIACGVLPIKLLHFTGNLNGAVNDLRWATATELNSEWHIVETSINGTGDWKEVGRTRGAGNSTTRRDYKLTDSKPLSRNYYRLKALDFDGSFEYSNVVLLERKKSDFGITNAYPNPTEDNVKIEYFADEDNTLTFKVLDVLGRTLETKTITPQIGGNFTDFDLSQYANAMYMITMESGTRRSVFKVIKSN